MLYEILGLVLVNGYAISEVKEGTLGLFYFEVNGIKTNLLIYRDLVENIRIDLIKRLQNNEKADSK